MPNNFAERKLIALTFSPEIGHTNIVLQSIFPSFWSLRVTHFVRSTVLLLGSVLITLLVPISLTLGSVRLLMTGAYLQVEYNKADFPPDDYGFTLADRLHYAPVAVAYLVSGPDNALSILTFPDGRAFYNSRELQHMADVRRVTQTAFAIGVAILAFCLLIGLLLSRSASGRTALRAGLMGGAALTLAAIVALAVGVLLAWETFFTGFHNMFFAAGTWTFEYSDSLIRLFPERFWQDAALTIGGFTVLGALIILGIGVIWAWRGHKSSIASHDIPI
jgi:integral membrane protein (TIGR01906 family)